MDGGAELRGSTMLSGPFAEYGVGIGADLGGGRINVDAARGAAPGGQPQYRGKIGWSKPFAYGGVVPREHHAGPNETNDNSNVAGDGGLSVVEQSPRFSRDNLPAESEPTGLDSRLVAMTTDKSDPDFDRSLRKTLKIEGGYTNDSGGPTMMGISSKANPDVDLKRVASDPQYKADIYKSRYYDPVVTPDMTPEMKTLAFDTAVNHGVSKAKEMLGEAGGDPAKLLQLRQQHYDSLIADNPDKYGRYDKGWRNRLASLASDADGSAPRPPKDVGPPEPGLGSFLSGKSGKGKYSGVDSANASLGDVVREYTPSGVPTSEDFWMPALGFLGGMLSSPNPKLLGAVGSGLVSGVSTQFEMDKLNQERAKNAFAMLKDRFEDAIGTDANGNSIPMKRDTRDGTLYSPEQMGAIQGQLLKAFGVTNPAAYGLKSGTAGPNAAPAATTTTIAPSTATTAAQAQPQPGETKVAENLPPGITKEQAANPVVQQAINAYPPPPPDMQKHEMSQAQLEANAFWNWKKEGLAQDPMPILQEIQRLKSEQAAWEARPGAAALCGLEAGPLGAQVGV